MSTLHNSLNNLTQSQIDSLKSKGIEVTQYTQQTKPTSNQPLIQYNEFKIKKDFGVLTVNLTRPYNDIKQIKEIDIILGLQNKDTSGTIKISKNCTKLYGCKTCFTKLAKHDSIIVGAHEFYIESIQSDTELTVKNPSDVDIIDLPYLISCPLDKVTIEYQYSTDNVIFSNWTLLDFEIYNLKFSPNIDTYFNIRITAKHLKNEILHFNGVKMLIERNNGLVENCPQVCASCQDPWLNQGCGLMMTCSNNTFDPYSVTKTNGLYKQLVQMTSNIFGISTRYYRIEPNEKSKDVILMEYSLYNVIDIQDVKIILPDGTLPDKSESTFDIFGINLPTFEIQITSAEFVSKFGIGSKPRARDIIYMPTISAIYQISTVTTGDPFNSQESYYKVYLKPYEPDNNIIDEHNLLREINEISTNTIEAFGSEFKQEFDKTTKPQQYFEADHSYNEPYRKSVNENLIITLYELKNRWNIISRSYYDFSNTNLKTASINYELDNLHDFKTTNQLSFSLWLKHINKDSTFIFKTNCFAIKITPTTLTVNDVSYNIPQIPLNEWYAFTFAYAHDLSKVTVYIYQHDNIQKNKKQNHKHTTELNNLKSYEHSHKFSLPSSKKAQILAKQCCATNIRLYTKYIDKSQVMNLLNQMIVRDSHYISLSDNAEKSLHLLKMKYTR